jgi:5-methylcytosine-specific restriction protein A
MRKPPARLPRGTLAERGYDKAYFRARALYMKDHPWCEMCARKGKWVKAEHCDHIETIKSRPDLRLDPKNFQSLCGSHHDLLTMSYDAGDLRGACDEDGLPLDPRHPWAQSTPEAAMATANAGFVRAPAPPGLAAKLKRRAVRGR